MEFVVDPAVRERFPGYAPRILVARGLRVTDAPFALERLRDAERHVRDHFGFAKAAEHPHLAAWRETFRAFGLKPSDYLNSSEALISRVLKGKDLPSIHPLVDAYNAVSIRHVVPVGGENLDAAVGTARLTFALGDEPFDTTLEGATVIQHPKPGEVVWRDDAGVTCRAWNWRQCVRTRLEGDIQNAYFVLDGLHPMTEAALEAAVQDLTGTLEALSPGCALERVPIS